MTDTANHEELSVFDQIIRKIGNAGRFQKRFYYTFDFFLVILGAMPYMNLIISVNVPDHWCHVPGTSNTTYTLEEWKNLTIPIEVNSKGIREYSKCKRFADISADYTNYENTNNTIIKCDRGWEYDYTWYDMTAPMQNDWVCDDKMVPSNALALSRAGEVVGTLVFGQLADNYGRMPIFFVTVATLVIGRVMSVLTSSWVYLFLLFSFIGSMPSMSIFLGPMIIAMEISSPDKRAFIGMLQSYGWNIGMIILPLVMWWQRDWIPFTFITTLPCAIFLLSWPWIIESPRWLASRGEIQRCIRELNKIAKTNNTQMPDNVEGQLQEAFGTQGVTKVYTIFALFSSPRLAKNTIVFILSWTTMHMIYLCLSMNVTNMNGNPFLNYMFQAMAELPAYLIGKYVCDWYGRRWTSFAAFTLTSLACVLILLFVDDSSYAWLVNGLCICIKFNVSLAYLCVSLHCMEIYPTCIRQTGISVGSIFANIFCILAPYIIALGVSVSAALPYVIYLCSSVLAAVCVLFLPETYGHQLPETLQDASVFGCNQDFWGKERLQKYTKLLDSSGAATAPRGVYVGNHDQYNEENIHYGAT